MPAVEIEIWADSFHEGDWACRRLAELVLADGGEHEISYLEGFIPRHTLTTENWAITLTVFGSYRSWRHLPDELSELLDWGKPDFIAFDPESRDIIFAVEESAATPTGNQALQRCERLYGAARLRVPFWYLLSEYGLHIDGGVRRDSVWPAIMSLKLSRGQSTPSVVLHYSDIDNPEDYLSGTGLKSLFTSLLIILENHTLGRPPLHAMVPVLTDQYQGMLEFIASQWQNLLPFLPGSEALASPTAAADYAAEACGVEDEARAWSETFLVWPRVPDLPENIRNNLRSRDLIKHDPLCVLLELDIEAGRAYGTSSGTGSRPQRPEAVAEWITAQQTLFDRSPTPDPAATFTMHSQDFPPSQGNLRHVTTSKRIVFLYDHWRDLRASIEAAYPRLAGRIPSDQDERPVLLYLSNSLKPGRIFGDPFTGQISAFAVCFGRFDPEPRMVVGYFPHQAHTQAIVEAGKRRGKGLTIMTELTDYLLFTGGVLISLSSEGIW
jgi:hypothetical protein